MTDAQGRTASASTTAIVSAVPPPTPPTPPDALAVTMGCTPGTVVIQTVCNLSATYGGAAIASTAMTSAAWEWGDGGVSATVPLGQHPYAQAGTYLIVATVTATTSAGVKTATASKSVVIP
jgi:hypothetical protein